MATIYLPGWPATHMIDGVSFEPGTVVTIEVPPGFYWRPARDGSIGIEVRARWWMRLWRALRRL
jgi:hypothetical protein